LDDLQRLVAIEDIKKTKARYFRCIDTKDWSGLERILAADVSFNRTRAASVQNPWSGAWTPPLPESELIVVGRENVVAMIRRAVENLITLHYGHMPEIDVLNSSTAAGIWAMDDILRHPDRGVVLHGSGHYRETYEKSATGWTIKTCELTRLSLFVGGTEERPGVYR
jgi:hypothetical protein